MVHTQTFTHMTCEPADKNPYIHTYTYFSKRLKYKAFLVLRVENTKKPLYKQTYIHTNVHTYIHTNTHTHTTLLLSHTYTPLNRLTKRHTYVDIFQ